MNTVSINYTQWEDNSLNDLDQYITANGINLELIYASDFKNAKILRDCIEYILKSFNISSKDISRYVLACDEMNNNAIEHGSKLGDENILRIELKKNTKWFELKIEVQDSWKGKTAKKAKEMIECKNQRTKTNFADHKSIRGRGLFLIIINIVDELYFNDSSTGWLIVWFKKDLPYSG